MRRATPARPMRAAYPSASRKVPNACALLGASCHSAKATAVFAVGAVGGAATGLLRYEAVSAAKSSLASTAGEMTPAGQLDMVREARFDELVTKACDGKFIKDSTNWGIGRTMRHKAVHQLSSELKGVPGVDTNLRLMAGNSYAAGKGRFEELIRAARYQRAGKPLAGIGVPVDVPGLGKTDIDILLQSGKWVENKAVKGMLSLTPEFTTKIDKIAAAVKAGLKVNGIAVNEGAFISSGHLSPRAIKYASDRGIDVLANAPRKAIV